jgi:Ser/Thr protein kinase RdoA (MazF antagonist)
MRQLDAFRWSGILRINRLLNRCPPRDAQGRLAELGAAPAWPRPGLPGHLNGVEGDVPDDLDPDFSDETVIAAARLIRRYHDAAARSTSAKGAEVVCHNDLSPCNFVFRERSPIAIIDFDSAAPAPAATTSATRCFSG